MALSDFVAVFYVGGVTGCLVMTIHAKRFGLSQWKRWLAALLWPIAPIALRDPKE